MTLNPLLILLILSTVATAAFGIYRKDMMLQLPTLTAIVVLVFTVPQFLTLHAELPSRQPYFDLTLLMVNLCFFSLLVGYRSYRNPGVIRYHRTVYRTQRLETAAWLMLVTGVFAAAVAHIAYGGSIAGTLSGTTVVLAFVGKCRFYALSLSTYLFLATKSKPMLACASLSAASVLDAVLMAGKRGSTSELILMILLALWLSKRIMLPRLVFGFALLFGAFLLYAVPAYREAYRLASIKDESEITRVSDAVSSLFQYDSPLELVGKTKPYETENAIAGIQIASERSRYDFGTSTWNSLVFFYVPAQIFGRDFKNSLMIGDQYTLASALNGAGYIIHPGTTLTGPCIAFGEFWFFGCIEFFILGYALKFIYIRALEGRIAYCLLYSICIVPALHAFTHSVVWAIQPAINFLIFLYPLLAWAAARPNIPYDGHKLDSFYVCET